MAVGKNIAWRKWEGDGKFGEENQHFKKWGMGKEINLQGTLYIPACLIVEDSEDEEKEAEDSDTMNDSDADELGTINCR